MSSMKQIYILLSFAFLALFDLGAQTTFNWETGSTNGVSVQQTVNTVTVTFTPETTVPFFLNGNGFAGSQGFVAASRPGEISVNLSFSRPINIETIFVFEGETNAAPRDWTFTPTGGSNPVVVEAVPINVNTAENPVYVGLDIVLNWTNVTEITITSEAGPDQFGVDDIVSDFSLSTADLNGSDLVVKLFPNPSTDFLQFSNLKQTVSYTVYNVLGSKVLHGSISDTEKIDIRKLTKGLYLLNLDNGETLKFIKE